MCSLLDRIVASTVAGMQRHGHEPSAQTIESYRATAKFIQAMAAGGARAATSKGGASWLSRARPPAQPD
jgi:hypothetical protein